VTDPELPDPAADPAAALAALPLVPLVSAPGVTEGEDIQPGDVLQASTVMVSAMKQLGDDVRGLSARGDRTRHLVWGLIVGFVCVAILAGLVWWAVVKANDATRAAHRLAAANAATIVATCEASNSTRLADITLWDHVLDLDPGTTPAQVTAENNLRAFVAQTFAPKVCG